MDPYCRIRVGHSVFETHTCPSGGKTPVWNKVIHAAIPSGVDSVYIEIFDERSFTMDDRVAWTHIPIPERVLAGETVDDWFPLNGKLGDEREGTINLVLSFNRVVTPPVQRVVYTAPGVMPMYAPMYAQPGAQPVMVMQPGSMPLYYGYPPAAGVPAGVMPAVQQPQPVARPVGPTFTEQDVAVVKDMFPNVDVEVVRSVLEANNGDKDATINNLLSMESS
jgi:toll-interacting protein